METSRVEAFSDGVFAVAITLLVLDLRVPLTEHSLLTALADEWPEFAAFVVSFVVIGVVWVNHHAIYQRVAAVDRPLLFINLFLLMSVVVIPFVTSLFAQYLTHADAQAATAGALYNGAMVLMSIGFQASTIWIDSHPILMKGHVQRATRGSQLRFAVGLFVYAACIPLSFLSPLLVISLDALVAAFYVGDQISLRVAER